MDPALSIEVPEDILATLTGAPSGMLSASSRANLEGLVQQLPRGRIRRAVFELHLPVDVHHRARNAPVERADVAVIVRGAEQLAPWVDAGVGAEFLAPLRFAWTESAAHPIARAWLEFDATPSAVARLAGVFLTPRRGTLSLAAEQCAQLFKVAGFSTDRVHRHLGAAIARGTLRQIGLMQRGTPELRVLLALLDESQLREVPWLGGGPIPRAARDLLAQARARGLGVALQFGYGNVEDRAPTRLGVEITPARSDVASAIALLAGVEPDAVAMPGWLEEWPAVKSSRRLRLSHLKWEVTPQGLGAGKIYLATRSPRAIGSAEES